MRSRLLLLCAILFFAGSAVAKDYYVDITNQTGFTIVYMYVGPASSDSWGDDLLGRNVMPNGETQRVTLSGFNSPIFDIRLVDEDGDSYTFYGIDVESYDIIVTLDHLD